MLGVRRVPFRSGGFFGVFLVDLVLRLRLVWFGLAWFVCCLVEFVLLLLLLLLLLRLLVVGCCCCCWLLLLLLLLLLGVKVVKVVLS